ncbi:hypothetical protein F4780DRAFT_660905 [Xylariomycetidae sp. FL0641]|nr:hypothetical protein F4780DRAFT_660905 [Xylariomycetidae sp. FL0641]
MGSRPPLDPALLPHDSKGHAVIITGGVTLSLAVVAVCARLYTRYAIINQIGVDDVLAVGSLIAAIGANVTQCVNASKYLGRHLYDLNLAVDMPEFQKLFWINEIWYNVAMFFVKMTFLFQYFRVFRHIKKMRLAYVVSMVLVGGWCLGQVLSVVFICIPVEGNWDKSIKAKCQDTQVGVHLNAVGTLVTDIVVLLLPLPALWKLKIPSTQKWALLGIFGLGGFTSAISIVRITTLNGGEDFTYASVTSACWSSAELASGILAAALATIRPLVSRVIPGLASIASRSTQGYHRHGYGPPTFGSTSQPANRSSMFVRGKLRGMGDVSEADLYPGRGFELREVSSPTQTRKGRLDDSPVSDDKSESFNYALEEQTPPQRPQRALSRPALSRPATGSYSGRVRTDDSSDEELGLWTGVQTKVSAGASAPPGLSPEQHRAARVRGLAIRVDHDWTVRSQHLEGSL